MHNVTAGQDPMTWVFVGDSITQGVLHTHGARSFVERCAETIRFDRGRIHDVVVNTGVSGWCVPDLIGDFDFRVTRFAPDVVVAMYGTNDAKAGLDGVADFREGLTEVLHRIRASGAQAVLQVPPPIRGESSGRAAMPAYADAIRAVAERESVWLVDHDAHWREHLPGSGLEPGQWLTDDIHPNAAGHQRMAGLVLEVLDSAFGTRAPG